MARHTFHGQIAAEAGSQSTDVVIKSQLDSGVASALNRANHTGTQSSTTISDFTAAVNALIENVVGAAPDALDTLQELAAALGNDDNFAASVTTQFTQVDARLDTLEAGTASGAFKQDLGDSINAIFEVTHNLASLDVIVEVFRMADGQTVFPVVTRTNPNAVTVDFGQSVPTINEFRVLVREV